MHAHVADQLMQVALIAQGKQAARRENLVFHQPGLDGEGFHRPVPVETPAQQRVEARLGFEGCGG